MYKKETAILFHKIVCSLCHRIPNDTVWMKQKESEGLDVFVSAKRHGRNRVWEPFFICTQQEPLWDERFNWEGQNNKMVQVIEFPNRYVAALSLTYLSQLLNILMFELFSVALTVHPL